MALSFDAPMNEGDFMPSVNEIEEYREKLKRYKELPGSSTKRFKHHMSKNDEQDEYDDYGRNISEQRLRQEMVPWVKVKYSLMVMPVPIRSLEDVPSETGSSLVIAETSPGERASRWLNTSIGKSCNLIDDSVCTAATIFVATFLDFLIL